MSSTPNITTRPIDAGSVKPVPDTMIRVNGKTFRCDCGCNVFRRQDDRYVCNACGERSEFEHVSPTDPTRKPTGGEKLMADLNGDTSLLTPEQREERILADSASAKIAAHTEPGKYTFSAKGGGVFHPGGEFLAYSAGPGNSSAIAAELNRLATERDAAIAQRDRLVEACRKLISANPAYRSKPVGAPGSLMRNAQDATIEAEDFALAAITEATR